MLSVDIAMLWYIDLKAIIKHDCAGALRISVIVSNQELKVLIYFHFCAVPPKCYILSSLHREVVFHKPKILELSYRWHCAECGYYNKCFSLLMKL